MSSTNKLWWHDAVIYQIYPRSFADGNGDGIGDFAGIAQHLDYLQDLGVDAVWFSPFYPSPQRDAGYDVADYFDVNPTFGTLEQAKEVFDQLHTRGLKVIIDLVPNHTSDQHEWFQQALAAGPGSPQRERYMFRYSPEGYPNNWGSMFGGHAWTQVQKRTGKAEDAGWWYLHLFDSSQPDLNWDNPDVLQYFDEFLRFWARQGVDGFRIDVAHGLVKAPGLPDDNIGSHRWSYEGEDAQVGPMFDQDGVHEIYRRWRRVLDEFGPDRMLVAEAWVANTKRLARYVRPDELSQSFNFQYLDAGWRPERLRRVIDRSLADNGEVGAPTTWVLSNHDVVRHATRFAYDPDDPLLAQQGAGIGPNDPQPDAALGLCRARAATLFMLGLPGSAYLFQGEELGLPEHTTLPGQVRQDPTFHRTEGRVLGRDGCRVPLPWTSDVQTNYGFSVPAVASSAEAPLTSPAPAWLPQPESWARFSAAANEADPDSVLHLYRKALALRKELQLGEGDLRWYAGADAATDLTRNQDVLAFQNGSTLVLINMGSEDLSLPPELAEKTPMISSLPHPTPGILAANQTLWLRR